MALRLSTNLILILLCLAIIIGLGIILSKSNNILYPLNVPGIVAYVLILLFFLIFDIYYSCIFKRFWDNAKEKLKEAHKKELEATKTVLTNGPYVNYNNLPHPQ